MNRRRRRSAGYLGLNKLENVAGKLGSSRNGRSRVW